MARIPQFVANGQVDTGNVVRFPTSSPVADAIQGLGGQLQQTSEALFQQQERAAERRLQQQEQDDNFKFQIAQRQLDEELNAALTQAAQDGEPDGAGLHDNFIGTADLYGNSLKEGKADEIIRKTLEALPGSQRGKFQAMTPLFRAEYGRKAASLELDKKQAFQRQEIEKTLDGLASSIQQTNPNDFNGLKAFADQGSAIIEASSLPSAEKMEAIRLWRQRSDETAWREVLRRDPEAARAMVPGSEPKGSIVDRIIGAESSGRADAKNPESSATGLGGFTSATWLEVIRRNAPQVANGKSRAELLALRNDPTVSRAVTQAYADENAAFLKAKGFEATDGNVYLAHFAGPQGAVNILEAVKAGRGDASFASLLGDKAAAANPSLAGMNASELVAWASRKMGQASPAAGGMFSSITPERWTVLSNAADAEINSRETQARQAVVAAVTQRKNELDLGIETGEVVDARLILDDPIIDAGDKAALLRRIEDKNKARQSARLGWDVIDGKADFNPYDAESRKSVNDAIETTGIGARIFEGDKEALNSAVTVSRKLNYAPQAVQDAIRGLTSSADPGKRATGYSAVLSITDANPNALAANPGGDALSKDAETFRHYTIDRGMTAQDAIKRIDELRSPENQVKMEAREKEARKLVEKIQPAELENLFDPSWLAYGPGLGASDDEKATLMAAYSEAFRENYLLSGDQALSKSLAAKEIKRTTGVTTLFGRNRITRYPPELFYEPVGPAENPHGYIEDQAIAAAREASGMANLDGSSVFLVATARTALAATTWPREPMPYLLSYRDEDGLLQVVPKLFTADPVKALADYRANLRERRMKQKQTPSLADPNFRGRYDRR